MIERSIPGCCLALLAISRIENGKIVEHREIAHQSGLSQ